MPLVGQPQQQDGCSSNPLGFLGFGFLFLVVVEPRSFVPKHLLYSTHACFFQATTYFA